MHKPQEARGEKQLLFPALHGDHSVRKLKQRWRGSHRGGLRPPARTPFPAVCRGCLADAGGQPLPTPSESICLWAVPNYKIVSKVMIIMV